MLPKAGVPNPVEPVLGVAPKPVEPNPVAAVLVEAPNVVFPKPVEPVAPNALVPEWGNYEFRLQSEVFRNLARTLPH